MSAVNEDHETMAVELGDLLDAGDGDIVKLVAGETRLAAHRAVLAAGSPVFAAMFGHDMLEASSGVVSIPDVEGPVLRQLLAYLYTHRVPQRFGMAPQLLAVADKYGVAALKAACEQMVVEQLSVENAAGAAVLAVAHSCPGLLKATVAVFRDHTHQLMSTKAWAEAVHNHPGAVVEFTRQLAETAAETSEQATADSTTTPVTQLQSDSGQTSATPAAAAPTTPPEGDGPVSRLWSLSGKAKNQRLIQATEAGALEQLKVLLAAGAEVGSRDEPGWTALHTAADRGQLEAMQCLLESGAEVDARDGGLSTPLHWAAHSGHAAVVKLLVESGADPSARDEDGRTPLHDAAEWGHMEAAAALLEAGADKTVRNQEGDTPLDLASELEHLELIEILK